MVVCEELLKIGFYQLTADKKIIGKYCQKNMDKKGLIAVAKDDNRAL